ncbi:WD40/YVTN repeat-like-containing domain [Phaffia rhodozyma]|uniref:WD40/YVTN repeat-like-containing domain n=1 Tax=Phaffia rhodozyma TaxID=264483 RepID=A0A0F7SJD8_PHARH|nr:WD40/YVTN repeat-like-containing domain [Phaffia rhodozyma]
MNITRVLDSLKPLGKPISSLLFHPSSEDYIVVASEDSSLRLLDLKTQRPLCAVVGFPFEISGMVFEKDSPEKFNEKDWGNVWVACGSDVHLLKLSAAPKFLRRFEPASVLRSLPNLSKDEINSLCLTEEANALGWCGDDGKLGIIDLETFNKKYMKGKHSNIAGAVSFVPGRPTTLLSIGYDSTARSWDTSSSVMLDFLSLNPPPGSQSNNLAPSFPLCLSTYLLPPASSVEAESEQDGEEPLIAIGTADGSIWITLPSRLIASDRSTETAENDTGFSKKDLKKKKNKKSGKNTLWKGIKEGSLERVEIALGPIIKVAYIPCPPSEHKFSEGLPYLVTLSHLGVLTIHRFGRSNKYRMDVSTVLTWNTDSIVKCNTLAVSAGCPRENPGSKVRIAVGGVGSKGEGFMECWDVEFD